MAMHGNRPSVYESAAVTTVDFKSKNAFEVTPETQSRAADALGFLHRIGEQVLEASERTAQPGSRTIWQRGRDSTVPKAALLALACAITAGAMQQAQANMVSHVLAAATMVSKTTQAVTRQVDKQAYGMAVLREAHPQRIAWNLSTSFVHEHGDSVFNKGIDVPGISVDVNSVSISVDTENPGISVDMDGPPVDVDAGRPHKVDKMDWAPNMPAN